jgi:hypothetical protein
MINGETPNFYPKLLDKDGCVINIGDTLYGEDGRMWKIQSVEYSENETFPIFAYEVDEDGDDVGVVEILKPKWLSRKNPKPKPSALAANTLDEWMADLQAAIVELPVGTYPLKNHLYTLKDKMRQVAERETKEDEWEDFV